jgi:hypothetical protein
MPTSPASAHQLGVLTEPADVHRMADRRRSDALLAGVSRHPACGDHGRVVPKTAVRVEEGGDRTLTDDLDFGGRIQLAPIELGDVLRPAQDPVRVVAGEVGTDQVARDLVSSARSRAHGPSKLGAEVAKRAGLGLDCVTHAGYLIRDRGAPFEPG